MAALALVAGCGGPERAAPTVLLVSWDTTRADALGAWSAESHWGHDIDPALRPRPRTPHADALAARGVRFAWALAHAPTTLNSHTTVFSGLDPHAHGVPRNGFPVAEATPLLAERFAAAGYATVATVGASVLAADQGLARGFSSYDDAISTRVRKRFERPADAVVDRLLQQVDALPATQPLFAFAHFFDAHSPYDGAPPALVARIGVEDYAGPVTGTSENADWMVRAARAGTLSVDDRRQARALYLAEVAAMDQALGRLLAGLERRGRLRDSLVVLFGDHGETLDEIPDRAYGHGLDVHLVDIHVPLIVAGQGSMSCGVPATVEQGTVSLRDIAPTVAACARVPGLGAGRDLFGAAVPSGLPHFAEATKGGAAPPPGRWNNLRTARSATDGQHHLMAWPALPRVSLHQRAAGQPPADDEVAALALERALAAWDEGAPPFRPEVVDAEQAEALRALGYLDAGGGR